MRLRRRRWIEVLRDTASALGAENPEVERQSSLEDPLLWSAADKASRAVRASTDGAIALAGAVLRQRAAAEVAAERATFLAARSEGLGPASTPIVQAFERLSVVALNAGLEGARTGEAYGRALMLLSEEVRANVTRGADAADELARLAEEVASEAAVVCRETDRSRDLATETSKQAADLQGSALQAAEALQEVERRLKHATGLDPATGRAVALAKDHARELAAALSTLVTSGPREPVLGALREALRPLHALLTELSKDAAPSGGEASGPESPP